MQATRAAVLAIGGLLALAGCGGGSRPPSVANFGTTASKRAAVTTPTAGELQSDGLKFSRCMRAKGVPAFPDPNDGGGFAFHAGSGIDPTSPVFGAAQAKCRKFMPAGPAAAGSTTHPSAQWLAQMVKAAACMRRHGISGFPDPTTKVPSMTGFVGVVSDIDGVIFVFPSPLDTKSPAFVRAARDCGFPLHNH